MLGPKARADLELDRILTALAERCASEAGARLASGLPFLERDAIARSLAEIDEAKGLSDEGAPLPEASVPAIADTVGRARIGAALSAEEVIALTKLLLAARTLRKFLKTHKERAPLLAQSCDIDPALDALGTELERSFEPDGSIADGASPRLAELRAELKSSRTHIVRRLEELVARYQPILSDGFWTERDGRYVLPVRADAHERFVGIVHGSSSGGATLFVEPRALVSMGNRHKVLGAQVAQEEAAVLMRLGALIAESIESVTFAASALAHADLRSAQAKLAVLLRLRAPEIPPPADPPDVRIELIRGRHPILQLDGVEVVPSDLSIAAGKVLVMSGPNAGGKTVALKTLGLAAAMLRLGLPVAAAEGSTVALVDEVLTDVGDDQSLAKNLSTFSAHVKNLVAILDATHRGSIVLLDEVASGTDPREGEALATAVLESLAARGGAVACTTHYEALKVLALSDDRFANASVGFDLETMAPTFQVLSGVPGASSALSVARRFGVPDALVARAESMLSTETVTISRLVEKLAADRLELEKAKSAVEAEREELAEKGAKLDAELGKLASRDRSAAVRETEELMVGVKRAREELRAAQARLRTQKLDEKGMAEAAKAIDKIAATVAIGGSLELPRADSVAPRESVKQSDLFPGMRVFVPRLRTEAEVLEVLSSGQVRVAAGPLKLLASVDEVRRAAGESKSKGARPTGKSAQPSRGKGSPLREVHARALASETFDAANDPDVPLQTSDNTVDLRGLRAHEAISMAEQFLDRCVGSGKRVAFLIHGHGTGALRQALRETLQKSPYVDRMRPGEPREGGDGVTVVWLR